MSAGILKIRTSEFLRSRLEEACVLVFHKNFFQLVFEIAAVFPLLKNKPELVSKAREIFLNLKSELLSQRNSVPHLEFDDNGNIGKRYRRQDEIGTPSCITIDFTTLEDNTVTLRDRDSGEQKRVKIEELPDLLK